MAHKDRERGSQRLSGVEWLLLSAIFLDLFGFGMLIPNFQFRAQELGAVPWQIGALLASTFFVQAVASPRWGGLSDQIGRKPVLIFCTLLSSLAMAAYALPSIWWLVGSRLLAGFGAANVAVAQAYIADLGGENRPSAMGRVGAAISLGLITGPWIGGQLSAAGGAPTIGLVAAACSFLGALGCMFGLPRVPVGSVQRRAPAFAIDLTLLRDVPELRRLVVIAAVAWYSLATLEGTFGLLIQRMLGYGPAQFGFLFGYESLISVFVQAVALGWIAARVSEGPLLRGGYLMQGLGLGLTPLAGVLAPAVPGMLSLIVASTLYALGQAIAGPTLNSLCSRLAPKERLGELFGLMQMARSLGFIVGPILGGALFSWKAASPYLLATAVCILAAFLARAPASGREPGNSTDKA